MNHESIYIYMYKIYIYISFTIYIYKVSQYHRKKTPATIPAALFCEQKPIASMVGNGRNAPNDPFPRGWLISNEKFGPAPWIRRFNIFCDDMEARDEKGEKKTMGKRGRLHL